MKKILLIHDISCFGKCSSTVALPIVSAMGLSGVLLPTALLSTHTSGFKHYTFLDLSDEIKKIVKHWQSFDLQFDAVYVGYLGSIEQIETLKALIPQLLKPEGTFYLDPVMADNGNYYPGFDDAYAQAMKAFADTADVLLPNQTEASLLYAVPYQEGTAGLAHVDDLLKQLKPKQSLVLTGAAKNDNGETGAFYYDGKTAQRGTATGPFIGDFYHGTGDIFASILVGAHANGATLAQATQLAVDTVPQIIQNSLDDPTTEIARDGLNFESALGDLAGFVHSL